MTDDGALKDWAVISPDGTQVVYHRWEPTNKSALWQIPSAGGPARKRREGDFLQVMDWTPSGESLVCYTSIRGDARYEVSEHVERFRFGLLDPSTCGFRSVIAHATRTMYRARISPGQRWIPIAAAPPANLYPFWSPDGKLLYFVSNRDGFQCVWAQPLDDASGQPVGPARDVLHLHGATRSLDHVRQGVWGSRSRGTAWFSVSVARALEL